MTGELEVVRLLRAIFPLAARRSAGEESQERPGVDLKGTPGLCAQVQLSSAPTIERKFAEALAAHRRGEEVPVAFTRRCSRSRSGEWLATLRARDLVLLLGSLPRRDYESVHSSRCEDGLVADGLGGLVRDVCAETRDDGPVEASA